MENLCLLQLRRFCLCWRYILRSRLHLRRELVLDLKSDGVSTHFECCGCVAEHLRGVVARGRLKDGRFDQYTAQRTLFRTAEVDLVQE